MACLMAAGSLSAQWGKKVRGNGNVTTETRNVGDYDAISISNAFTVYLVDGAEGQLSLEGEENLLEYVVTEVRGDRLYIKFRKGVQLSASRNSEGLKVRVPVSEISAIDVSGACGVIGETRLKSNRFKASMSGASNARLELETGDLEAELSGASNLKLSGRAGSFRIQGSGASDLNAYELETDSVDAEISGSADAEVQVRQQLKANVSGAGDLKYRGNPEKMESKASGAGNVRKS